jgi:two-component system, NarL family, nitrate/nitrite response regulator NarL
MMSVAAADGPVEETGPVVRVCICSVVRIYREGLTETLARQHRIEVAGASADEAGTLELVRREQPDVILVDTTLPISRDLLRSIAAEAAATRIIALAVADEEDEILDYAEAGIAGYVTRDASHADLVEAIERAGRGEALCSPQIAGSLLRRVSALAAAQAAAREPAPGRLTTREREIVTLIDEGLSNKEIAARLTIELPTVKNHVHHILAKLKVDRRGEAAALLRTRD